MPGPNSSRRNISTVVQLTWIGGLDMGLGASKNAHFARGKSIIGPLGEQPSPPAGFEAGEEFAGSPDAHGAIGFADGEGD